MTSPAPRAAPRDSCPPCRGRSWPRRPRRADQETGSASFGRLPASGGAWTWHPSRWSSESSLGAGARASCLMCRTSRIEAAFEARCCRVERSALLRVKVRPTRCPRRRPPLAVSAARPGCGSVAGCQPLVLAAGDGGLSPTAPEVGPSGGGFWILTPLPAPVGLEYLGEEPSDGSRSFCPTAPCRRPQQCSLGRCQLTYLWKTFVPNYLREVFIKELLKTSEVCKKKN